MARIQAVWAIDIGQAALKGLKLVPGETAEQVVAEAFDFIEYPKILSQPDADPEELVREALETFLGRNDLKGARVAVAVPGQAGLVKFIKLPPVEKRRIPDIVKFEARQQIPFALEEVIWDYQQIAEDNEDGEEGDEDFAMTEVGLFAMKRDQIFRALQPFRAAGIEVDLVQVSPIALYNFAAFEQLARKTAKPGSVVLLDIGADNTDLIITDGARIWQRNVPIGGNHFTRALTKELKLTFAKAEHLKRNAIKSPDPRAVFTAMRGVFNDLSSEAGRSIGFYSSVNRRAKIVKIVGLGNGFKLPGLQKFLQQTLNHDVARLEVFEHLAGEEVTTAPQFVENLMSFAVAYGLGVQGLELSKLRTNLLPPEVQRARLVRRKKPWALAASVLVMLGFSALFLGDYNALAKVDNPKMKEALSRAKSASATGSSYKAQYDAAKSAFNSKKAEGEGLVAATPGQASWPALLTTLNAAIPNPPAELGIDPNLPASQEILRDLRVYIGAIVPRFRTDLRADWFDLKDLQGFPRNYMHPYDRSNPPVGEGWIIQIVGHHYNPSPYGKAASKLSDKEKQFAKGPVPYLTDVVIPRFWTPKMRQFGIHHATLTWVQIDKEWVTSKVAGTTALPNAPLLAKPTPPTPAAGSSEGGRGMEMGTMYASMRRNGMAPGMGQDSSAMMAPVYKSMIAGPGMMGPGPATKKMMEETTLTRTDFMIQLLWQPPTADKEARPIEEIQKVLAEAEKAQGAPKALTEEEIKKASMEAQKRALEVEAKAIAGAAKAPGAPATGAAPPVAAPAIPK